MASSSSSQWTHENTGELPFLSPDTSKRIHAKFSMPALPPERLIDLSSLHQSEGVSLGRCGRWVEVRRGWQVTPLQSKPTTGTCSSVTPSAAQGWREASVKTRSHTRFIIFNRIKYHKVHTLTAKFSRYTIRFLFYISFWEAATVARRGPHVFFFFFIISSTFSPHSYSYNSGS